MKKRLIILILLFMTASLIPGCQKSEAGNEAGGILIQYYYFNVCGSCDPESEFLDKFESLTGLSADNPGLKIEMYNVKDLDGLDAWEKTAEEFGLSPEENEFPVLRIGDEIKLSAEIEPSLKNDIEKIAEERDLIPINASVIYYFFAPGCHDCQKTQDEVLSKLPNQIEVDGEISPVHIIKVSLAHPDGVALFRTYCDEYYVSEEKQLVPIAFIGYNALAGTDEIAELEDILANGEGLETPVFKSGEKQGGAFNNYSWIGVLATGLLNGINPCSVSMILMLLSLIAMDKKKTLTIGLPFVLGKFLGFLLLGTILYNVLSKIDFEGISFVVKIVLLILSGTLAVLNFNDFVGAKSEKYQKIKLQLPKALRKYNHEWIKKAAALENPKLLAGGGLLLGLILSGGEFLCTGQLYLAVILNGIHSGIDFAGKAALYLILYSTAFVLPLLILVLLIMAGRRVFDLSNMFRNNMPWIKFGNMIIFLAFFVLVILFY